ARLDREMELREELRKAHEVGDEDADGHAVYPRGRRPAEVDRDVPALELLLEERQQRGDAPIDAAGLHRKAIVTLRHLRRDRRSRREEHDEGGAGFVIADLDLSGAAEVDVER